MSGSLFTAINSLVLKLKTPQYFDIKDQLIKDINRNAYNINEIKNNQTPLMYAINKKVITDFVIDFIKTGKSNPEYVNSNGDTPLILLFKNLGPISGGLNFQQYPIIVAILLLIETGKVNLAQENIEGKRAYDYAVEYGLPQLANTNKNIKLIMDALLSGAEIPSPPGTTPESESSAPETTPPIPPTSDTTETDTSPRSFESSDRQCQSEGKEPTPINSVRDYRVQTRIFHPDKNRDCIAEATEKMKKLNSMYQNFQNLNSRARGGKNKKSKKLRRRTKQRKSTKRKSNKRKTIRRK